MGSLNTRQLEAYARPLCIARDGNICQGCGKKFDELNSVINLHHKNGNRDFNPPDGSNWQLLCHSCNVLKWHKQKLEVILDGGSPDGSSLVLTVGTKMEFRWTKWLYAQLLQKKIVRESYAIKTGAREIDGSPETTKRYLSTHIEDPNHPKSIFRRVYKDYDEYIKFTIHVQDSLDSNQNYI